MENYSHTITVTTTPEKAYDALIHKIPLWWSELFKGSSSQTGEVFTIRFGEHIHKTMRVKELKVSSKVIWYVEDSLIAIPELKNQTEWIGTTIIWDIEHKESNTQIKITHIGLNPDIECYEICANGWIQFINSLKLFLETGKGNPYREYAEESPARS
ncbi:hypothetical protein [Chryseobacterium sp.]|uniref:hypothetical protein n=1 Tax=Chryseobacterium sp. TaxID=1871047 RepID=UPI0025C6D19D|nr:hypothetical protein [Chryseobacterium sp.]MBV8325462.1 hypothetical protein [Chryseobacterium sp.]